ncbi:MAG: hypothetical protein JJT78_12335, partial [Leptospira sp.]|nr:hypothetical protein [Leptospira sp.]
AHKQKIHDFWIVCVAHFHCLRHFLFFINPRDLLELNILLIAIAITPNSTGEAEVESPQLTHPNEQALLNLTFSKLFYLCELSVSVNSVSLW